MDSSTKNTHVIIGGGISGCILAYLKRSLGYSVILIEKEPETSGALPIGTKTTKVVSENHSGAEYPFDNISSTDCFEGRILNELLFPDFIYAGKDYTRVIASRSMANVISACDLNNELIKKNYIKSIKEIGEIFGKAEHAVKVEDNEVHKNQVNDIGKVYVTPQRGINPIYLASLLEFTLKNIGVDFRAGWEVNSITMQSDGSYLVKANNNDSSITTVTASNLSICAGVYGLSLAKMINPKIQLSPLFIGLRNITLVELKEKYPIEYTYLKLEGQYGGMFSPLNSKVALLYHPPTAHINTINLNSDTNYFSKVRSHLNASWDARKGVSEKTLEKLKEHYPMIDFAEILQSFNTVTINSVNEPRIRRNMGITKVATRCTLHILPKWTMCVKNALEELEVEIGTTLKKKAEFLLRHKIMVPNDWVVNFDSFYKSAKIHAKNLGFSEKTIKPMNIQNIKSLYP